MRKNVLISCLGFMFLVLSGSLLVAQNWYDTDWAYRTPVTISNPCDEEVTEYQVNINLDSTFNFSKALSNGQDLRVADSDGVTLIPFWIENWDAAGKSASIWVKVPVIPHLGSTTIFLYYGNPSPPPPELIEVPPIGPWEKASGNPIIPIGDPGGGTRLLAENIVYDGATGHYWLVFAVYRSGSHVGLAWSDDPGDPAAWNWQGIVINNANAPHIIEYGGTWYIFYADRGHGGPPYPISVSTSSTVSGPYTYAGKILESTEIWETYRVDEPYVFQRNDGKWILMYMGDQGSTTELIGYAEANSIMGPYTKYSGNPCIDFGPPGSIDAGTVADPWVVEFEGTYYIGYTVSPTKSSPWRTAYVTTTDWVNFEKHGIILDLGGLGDPDQANAFRGAVTRFGDTYYFSYTGATSAGQYNMCMATQPAFMEEKINCCECVFEFCDDFEGDSLDMSRWSRSDYGSGHTVDVTDGNLVMTANASSPYGYFQLKANKSIGKGTLLEAYAIHPDAGKNCDADGDAETAAEIGYKVDFGWNNVIRMMDYPDLTKYTIQATASGNNSGYISTSVNVDSGWHMYRIYRPESGTSEFQIDNNPFESIAATHTPSIELSPWLMSYAEPCASQNVFKVDWIRVRKWCGIEPSILVGIEESCQIEITIDIKPGSDTNPINLGSKGIIPVAIFSTADFDAQTVDPSTVRLAGASVKMKKNGEYMAAFEDVDKDGLIDIVLHFITAELELSSGDTTAMLDGQTFDGTLFWGEDTVIVIAK